MLFKGWKTTPGPGGTWHPAASGVPLHSRIADRFSLPLRLARFRIATRFWLQQLELELRSLRGRMRMLRGTNNGHGPSGCGPIYELHAPDQQWSLETLRNSAYIEIALSNRDWLSDVDLLLIREGARLGAAYARGSAGTRAHQWQAACRNLSNRDEIIAEIVEAIQAELSTTPEKVS